MSMPRFITKNLKTVERLVTSNSPAVLTAAGVIGIVGTTVLTYKATVKTVRALDDERYKRNINKVTAGDPPAITKMEAFKIVGKYWLAPTAVASLSIASVIGAQYINTKRAAAIAAAYVALEGKQEEYKEKVQELFGEKKAQQVDEAIHKDWVNAHRVAELQVAPGDVPCLDALSNKLFSSNLETLRKAENDINARINHGDQPSVTDLYACIKGGLEQTRLSDAFGWNDENMCEMKFTTQMTDDGTPVLVMDFSVLPVGNFWRVGR